MTRYILGVDPGGDGGAVIVDDSLALHQIISFKTDANWIRNLFEAAKLVDAICFENVHSMPGQGVASSFKFGKSAGAAEAAIKCATIRPITFIQPQYWQRVLNLPSYPDVIDRRKRRALLRKDQERFARKWYTDALLAWKTTNHGDIYGAILIARAGAMIGAQPYQKADAYIGVLSDLI